MKRDEPWAVKVHKLAADDLRRMKANSPALFDAMIHGVTLLAQESDPFAPRNRQLDVCRSYPHARGCLRLKIKGQHWRVVLRVIETVNGYSYMVEPDEELDPKGEAHLQIVFADVRSEATYNVYLADRWEQVA
jgi:hypothetical protein